MNILSVITNLGGALVSPVLDYYKHKRELAAQKRIKELEIQDAKDSRKVDLIRQGQADQAAWELKSIENSGWKDEALLILLFLPVIAVFFPGLVEYIKAGFAVLETLPEWYRWSLLVVVSSVYGYRPLANAMKKPPAGVPRRPTKTTGEIHANQAPHTTGGRGRSVSRSR